MQQISLSVVKRAALVRPSFSTALLADADGFGEPACRRVDVLWALLRNNRILTPASEPLWNL
ncbi:hypothetical protein [Streptomyces sp. NRRL F-5122]|uniref:hypothetical protein n=1 Tax=Streptomyces sp. NRRL F-5122 TaxID=1609098 RepID=UPI000A4EAF38|nr:hypothetical protein [Streptomyces sp. NRRL F-5122]